MSKKRRYNKQVKVSCIDASQGKEVYKKNKSFHDILFINLNFFEKMEPMYYSERHSYSEKTSNAYGHTSERWFRDITSIYCQSF